MKSIFCSTFSKSGLTHPQYISRLAFYTIPLILVASMLAYINNYKLISLLLVGIFITSVIHWNKHSQYSFIRFLDVFLVAILIMAIVYYIYYYLNNNQSPLIPNNKNDEIYLLLL